MCGSGSRATSTSPRCCATPKRAPRSSRSRTSRRRCPSCSDMRSQHEQRRAAADRSSTDKTRAIDAPVPDANVEIGRVAGRTRDDETAAFIMTVLLFLTITTYGAMVLSGVVEEKASRVVEVLLARMPARNLLAGKMTGLGLLGLAQITLTAAVALIAATLTDAFDVPAVRGATLAWIVVWFVLGYALY